MVFNHVNLKRSFWQYVIVVLCLLEISMLFIESWNQNGIKVIHGLFVETTESTENKSAHILRMTKDVIISDMNLSKFQSCMSIVCTWGTRIKLK